MIVSMLALLLVLLPVGALIPLLVLLLLRLLLTTTNTNNIDAGTDSCVSFKSGVCSVDHGTDHGTFIRESGVPGYSSREFIRRSY